MKSLAILLFLIKITPCAQAAYKIATALAFSLPFHSPFGRNPGVKIEFKTDSFYARARNTWNPMSLHKFEIRRPASRDVVAVAVLTLALCAAMNVVIFTLIHSVLLRGLPFPTPDLLVTVFNTHPKTAVEPDRGDNRKS